MDADSVNLGPARNLVQQHFNIAPESAASVLRLRIRCVNSAPGDARHHPPTALSERSAHARHRSTSARSKRQH